MSQFTLLGSLKRGTKPDFKAAAAPAEALETYRALLDRIREGFKEPGRVKDGVFGAMMKVRGWWGGGVGGGGGRGGWGGGSEGPREREKEEREKREREMFSRFFTKAGEKQKTFKKYTRWRS